MSGRHAKPRQFYRVTRKAAAVAVAAGATAFGVSPSSGPISVQAPSPPVTGSDTGPHFFRLDSESARVAAHQHREAVVHREHEASQHPAALTPPAPHQEVPRAGSPPVVKPPVAQPPPMRPPAPKPTVPKPPPVVTLDASSVQSQIAAYARRFAGVPYSYGGTSPSGWDCSGFAEYVYGHFGISLPRTSEAQYLGARYVAASQAVPGDLVFFLSGGNSFHTGIYLGNGEMISALDPAYGTKITSVSWGGSVYVFGQYVK